MKILLILLFMCISCLAYCGTLTLVSDNTIGFPGKSQVFSEDTPYIETGAEVYLDEKNSDSESFKTFANGINSKDKGISNGKCPYTDGSFLAGFGVAGNIQDQTWSNWGGGKPVTVIFDLKDLYPVTRIDIYSLTNEQLFTEKAEVFLSADNETWFARGTFENTEERTNETKMSVLSPIIMPLLNTRYVKLVIYPTGMYQQQIGEIAIWADMDNPNVADVSHRENVSFTARSMGFGAVFCDLSEFAKKNISVKEYKVYYSQNKFDNIKDAEFFGSFAPDSKNISIYPLRPGKTYYVAITAVYDNGEYENFDIVTVDIPKNYEAKTFNDMMAINHYPGGGGAHQAREGVSQWDYCARVILSEIPFRETRFWYAFEDTVKSFYNQG
ncbi:MAG: discoidin domain-containing protein, partial [Armatimonadetes bacterium]|nr:discoidin domain-containing protein [Candidatus Hippobium faecium]